MTSAAAGHLPRRRPGRARCAGRRGSAGRPAGTAARRSSSPAASHWSRQQRAARAGAVRRPARSTSGNSRRPRGRASGRRQRGRGSRPGGTRRADEACARRPAGRRRRRGVPALPELDGRARSRRPGIGRVGVDVDLVGEDADAQLRRVGVEAVAGLDADRQQEQRQVVVERRRTAARRATRRARGRRRRVGGPGRRSACRSRAVGPGAARSLDRSAVRRSRPPRAGPSGRSAGFRPTCGAASSRRGPASGPGAAG